MLSEKVLSEVKDRLVRAYLPEAIYLFGSYAWGKPDEESDVDLLVVVSDEADLPKPLGLKGQQALSGLNISKDIMVMRKKKFLEQASHNSTLCHKIKRKGARLYGNL